MDISIKNISIKVPNKTLLENTDLIISNKRRYGIIGNNGIGKSTLLKHINRRIIPVPIDIDIFYVEQEVPSSANSVFNEVIRSNVDRENIMNEFLNLDNIISDNDVISDDIMSRYTVLQEIIKDNNYYRDESTVRKILYGLGFSLEDQEKPLSDYSGGWRMRISLAKALYIRPTLLLLDEPTNHLDLNAVIWLTDYLSKWDKTLLIVSHDRNFLNKVCTDIICIEQMRLKYFRGNYDSYIKTYTSDMIHTKKEWDKVQKKVREMKNKATPKKIVKEYLDDNIHKRPIEEYKVKINFADTKRLRDPVLIMESVSFGYSPDKILFEDINFRLDNDDKIIIVGNNGTGKTTIMKLLSGTLKPIKGIISIDKNVRIGYYNQHSSDILKDNMTPIEFIHQIDENLSVSEIRKYLGMFGLPGKLHHKKMKILSGGQKARVLFAMLRVQVPHILLLDEPTNHLDIKTVDTLIDAINNFNGPVIIITHNIDMIEKIDCYVYELADGKFENIYFEDYTDKIINKIENI